MTEANVEPMPEEEPVVATSDATPDPISELLAVAGGLRGEVEAALGPEQAVAVVEAAHARGDREIRAAIDEARESLGRVEVGEKKHGGQGTYAIVERVHEARLRDLEALTEEENKAIGAINSDADFTRDGKAKRAVAIRQEFTRKREKIDGDAQKKIEDLVSQREERLREAIAQGAEARRDPLLEALGRSRDASRATALFQRFQTLEDREVRGLLVNLIEQDSELLPAALEAASLHFVKDPAALIPIVSHLSEGGPRGTQCILQDKRRLRAACELHLLKELRNRMKHDRSLADRNPGAIDMILARARAGS